MAVKLKREKITFEPFTLHSANWTLQFQAERCLKWDHWSNPLIPYRLSIFWSVTVCDVTATICKTDSEISLVLLQFAGQ